MSRRPYPKGVVGTIHRGEVSASLYNYGWSAHVPHGTIPVTIEGSQKAAQRNAVVRAALAQRDIEWIAFIDSDMEIEPEQLDWVIKLLDCELPYVSAKCVMRGFPFDTNAFKSLEPALRYRAHEMLSRQGVIKVAAVGTGAVLIRREVFEAVGDPYFEVGQLDPEDDAEDLHFSLKAAAAGYSPHVDCRTRIGHITRVTLFPGDDGYVWVRWPGGEDMRSRIPLVEDAKAIKLLQQGVHP
jgi:GT2 family glycosyltransferase